MAYGLKACSCYPLISTSVKLGNEMDNLSMCVKFYLIVQRLTPALVDLFFGSYDSVSLRVMRRIYG